MKTAEQQLSTYKSVHLNKKNVITHFFGVPLIIWSVSLSLSTIVFHIELFEQTIALSVAVIFFSLTLLYYFKLHWRLALGLSLFILLTLYSSRLVAEHPNALIIAISVFVVGWIIQFIGHVFEKAKPAFVDDLNQLLIGPFFLLAEVYFLLGFEQELEAKVTQEAITKRRKLNKSTADKV
jgi:uncharacterized membrane protein YGL010W